jgi:hypothetical protein
MRNGIRVLSTLGIMFWVQTVWTHPLADAYTAATFHDKLVICAPALVKGRGSVELAMLRVADRGDMAEAKELSHMAFNYRRAATRRTQLCSIRRGNCLPFTGTSRA